MTDLRIRPDLAAALDAGRAVVALESTLIAHGLPQPDNLEVARRVEKIVAAEGALAATIAVIDGRPTVGLDDDELQRIAGEADVPKVGVRDLPMCIAAGGLGATTAGSTAHLAARAGIAVFATGGLGGVHREARESWDESADLHNLAGAPVIVVCAGVKSILDVGATLERLETLSVPLVGYGTRAFPGFYLSDSGHGLDWSVDSPQEVAAVFAARRAAGLDQVALVVAQPLPADEQLDPDLHDRVLAAGLEELRARGITGSAVTPFLLEHFRDGTDGRSLAVNVRILERNAALAARIAVVLSAA